MHGPIRNVKPHFPYFTRAVLQHILFGQRSLTAYAERATGTVSPESMGILKEREAELDIKDGILPTQLFCVNMDVDSINKYAGPVSGPSQHPKGVLHWPLVGNARTASALCGISQASFYLKVYNVLLAVTHARVFDVSARIALHCIGCDRKKLEELKTAQKEYRCRDSVRDPKVRDFLNKNLQAQEELLLKIGAQVCLGPGFGLVFCVSLSALVAHEQQHAAPFAWAQQAYRNCCGRCSLARTHILYLRSVCGEHVV
jgi:hypothetical protein